MIGSKSVQSSLSLHTLAIADGRVYAWGLNNHGQCGSPSPEMVTRPQEVVLGAGEEVVETASGLLHSLARTASGRVFAWGCNESGQLGLGHTRRCEGVSQVDLGGERVVAVACGGRFSLAVTEKGRVLGWGAAEQGQVGGGEVRQEKVTSARVVAEAGKEEVVAVACGEAHGLAVTKSGRVVGWGRNTNGQLGSEGGGEVAVGGRAVAAACGSEHSVVVTELGRVWVFGSNRFGQLGLGGQERGVQRTPAEVTFFSDEAGVLVAGVACGAHHTLVLSDTGRVFAMGWNEYGQLGIAGDAESIREQEAALSKIGDTEQRWLAIAAAEKKAQTSLVPEEIRLPELAAAVGCGREHSFAVAVAAPHRVYGWGFNGAGQLGLGTRTDQPGPVAMEPVKGVEFSQIGSVLRLQKEGDWAATIRRQAIFLQQELRQLEFAKMHFGQITGGDARKSSKDGGLNLRHSRGKRKSIPLKDKVHCPNCEKPLKKDLHFCVHCGHKMEVAVPQLVSSASAPSSPVPDKGTTFSSAPSSPVSALTLTPAPQRPPTLSVVTAESAPAQLESPIPIPQPRMSSLQRAVAEMPSPAPLIKTDETDAKDRRSSIDALETVKIVSKRLSHKTAKAGGGGGGGGVGPATPDVRICPKCKQPMSIDERARGADRNFYHIACLRTVE